MPFRRSSAAALVAVVVPMVAFATIGTACSGDSHQPSMVEPDEVYVAVIRWELEREAAATDDSTNTTDGGDALPVVYVAAADGSAISAKVQARVAGATVDDANVRFADARDDVLDLNADNQPVKDDGVLLSIERVEPDAAQQRTIEVAVYRSLDDQQTFVLTVDAEGDGATITSSTLKPS